MPGKHHYLVVKDIEGVIAKHRTEVTFARAESQTSYVTLNVTIVYRAKINLLHFFCFSFLFITSWYNEKLLLFIPVYKILVHMYVNNYLYFFSPFITTFAYRIRRFYTFPKRKQSLYIFTGYFDKWSIWYSNCPFNTIYRNI